MEKLRAIVDEAVAELDDSFTQEHVQKVSKIVESAVIRGMLEGQHRAVDTCREEAGEAELDIAHRIAAAIRRKNDLLITNLSSLR